MIRITSSTVTFCGPQDTTESCKHPTSSSPSVFVYIWAYLIQSYLYSEADIMLGDAFGHRVDSSVENKAMKISRSKQALLKKRGRNVHSKHNKASANINKRSFKSPLTTHEELKPAHSKPATNKQVTCFIIGLVIADLEHVPLALPHFQCSLHWTKG